MSKKQIRYIHTINGEVGVYDGDQICYVWGRSIVNTEKSLSEIKKQRRASIALRKKMGFKDDAKYSHIRILV